MLQLTKGSELRIEKLVKEFTKEVLADQNPKSMCLTICLPLHIHLINNGFINSLCGGLYQDTPHYWLSLEDYEDTIVDPTIRQFNNNAPSIFIGQKPKDYPDGYKYKFADIYPCWLKGLCGERSNLSEVVSTECLLSINLKALSILIMETEHREHPVPGEFEMYLKGVSNALMKYYEITWT